MQHSSSNIHVSVLKIFALTLCLWWSAFTFAEDFGTLHNTVFQSREKITYSAFYNWGFLWLNAGEVTFSVSDSTYNNNRAYYIKGLGRTHRKYDAFFKVRDTFEIFMQPDTLSTYYYRRATYEGPTRTRIHYQADFDSMKIHAEKIESNNTLRHESYAIETDSYNVLSAIYAVRNFDFSNTPVDEVIPFKLWIDMEYSDIYVRYRGVSDVKLKDGSVYNCLVFSPLLVEGTLFRDGEGMKVYVTNDRNRVPIMIEAKILVGSVKAIVKDLENLRYPIESRIK